MNKPKILVTGASGRTGNIVVSLLRAADYPVRAAVRTRDARSDALERLGAEVVTADVFDARELASAMRGTRRAFFLPVYHPHMIHSATAFALAAQEAKLEVIVGLSQWLASPSHPAMLTRHHWLADELFSSLPGIGYVKINPGYFADNYLRLIDFAAHLGILPNLTGDSRNAPPSYEDIARTAAAALMRPDGHVGKSYRPTGPALLSVPQMADVLTRVLGRKVRPMPMPIWMLTKAARIQGVSPFELSILAHYIRDHREGAFELGGPTSDVLKVTGAPAEDFAVTAQRYAGLPQAQRSFGRTARVWFDFMRTPISPGYDLAAYERDMGFPEPTKPLYAMSDDAWKRAREAQRTQQSNVVPLVARSA